MRNFLAYTEIKTKITSVFAFLLSLAYLSYQKQTISFGLTALFFVAMFTFDLTTTAINNYIDTKTNEQVLPFSRRSAFFIILLLFAISAAAGILLVFFTDIVVLVVGALCFLCGILYTGGPVPISRQPLGELLSGIFYGLFIPFLILYINMPTGTFFDLGADAQTVRITLKIWPLITLLLLSVFPVCATANIMLANNICDVGKDVAVKRFTLPYYLGNKASLYLFAILYYATYAAAILMVIWGMLPAICLLYLLTILPVQKNIGVFFKKQDKASTFIVSIKNYVITMGAISLLVFAGRFVP